MKPNEKKYLENKIGLLIATASGHAMGASFAAWKNGVQYNYDMGSRMRKQIEKDMRDLFKYAYNAGKKEGKLLSVDEKEI